MKGNVANEKKQVLCECELPNALYVLERAKLHNSQTPKSLVLSAHVHLACWWNAGTSRFTALDVAAFQMFDVKTQDQQLQQESRTSRQSALQPCLVDARGVTLPC